MALARTHGCKLVVNDYWQEAIAQARASCISARRILARADSAGHQSGRDEARRQHPSDTELDAALAADPDYVALGPIYATTLKAMPWAPQGLPRACRMAAKIDCRLVAIGGISLDRAPLVLAAGADSVAVITDIMTSRRS